MFATIPTANIVEKTERVSVFVSTSRLKGETHPCTRLVMKSWSAKQWQTSSIELEINFISAEWRRRLWPACEQQLTFEFSSLEKDTLRQRRMKIECMRERDKNHLRDRHQPASQPTPPPHIQQCRLVSVSLRFFGVKPNANKTVIKQQKCTPNMTRMSS